MDKQAILNELKASGEHKTADDTPVWRKAFDAYNAATGSKLKARDRCSKCFAAVREWLES